MRTCSRYSGHSTSLSLTGEEGHAVGKLSALGEAIQILKSEDSVCLVINKTLAIRDDSTIMFHSFVCAAQSSDVYK